VNLIEFGDCRDTMRRWAEQGVKAQMCVTSPPYFGLRDYGHEGQIGLEQTPEQYIAAMVEVFRCVRDVLADDGTLWLNIGDSYANRGYQVEQTKGGAKHGPAQAVNGRGQKASDYGLKPKDLIGIPWMLAFALQADGWVLRQDIVWSKSNPMPESVKDRCTKSHEMIFLFSKARWIGDMPPRRMKRDDARWLAILLETEGNIAIRRYTHKRETPQHALQIAIANSDISILQEARRIAGCGSILTTKGCNRPVYYLQWTTKEAAGLLWEMYPFLFGKKRQAAIGLMLESRRSNRNKGVRGDIFNKDGRHFYLKPEEIELREKMWKAVKALNKHEPVDLSWLIEPKEGRWDSQPYYFDHEAIKEPAVSEKPAGNKRHKYADAYAAGDSEEHRTKAGLLALAGVEWKTRNRRSVWTVATRPYKGAHFATFPPALIEPCILAGSSERGHCPECGARWVREMEVVSESSWAARKAAGHVSDRGGSVKIQKDHGATHDFDNKAGGFGTPKVTRQIGWKPTCTCGREPVPDIVLDPFMGSGTTAAVAIKHGRQYLGCELNPEYGALQAERINEAMEAAAEAAAQPDLFERAA
jgi:DNA modification methylase